MVTEIPEMEKVPLKSNLKLLLICTLIGVAIHFFIVQQVLINSILISNGIGFTIRYTSLWLKKKQPEIPRYVQYAISCGIAFICWAIVPLALLNLAYPKQLVDNFEFYSNIVFVTLLVIFAVSYSYYRSEQAFKLQQALDRAEVVRIKQEKQLLEVQLRVLQSQIEPHFLFNTLANIQALISIDPKLANNMLAALTALLRHSLSLTRNSKVTLQQELAFNQAYLDIQQIRLQDRLNFELDIADDVNLQTDFPPMLLQPLIENAVVHGIEPLACGGMVKLMIYQQQKSLMIQLMNDYLVNQSNHNGHSVGLSTSKQRFVQLYGEQARFDIETDDNRFVITMEVPLDV